MQFDQPVHKLPFLEAETIKNIFDVSLSPYLCRFHKDLYRDEFFHSFDISFPESLKSAVVKRRAEFLAGRYCAQKAAQMFGIEGLQVDVGLHRNPLWPASLVGSISHSNSYAIAVLGLATDWCGLGVDIEKEISRETMLNIQDQILSEDELRYIAQHPELLAQLFTICFSVKESFFKAVYPSVGRYFGFDVVSVRSIDIGKQHILLQLNETLTENLNAGDYFYASYVCLKENHLLTTVSLKRFI